MFSMYDVILKALNHWQGKVIGFLCRDTGKKLDLVSKSMGFHYVSYEYFSADWYLNVENQHFSNYQCSEHQKSVYDFSEDELIFGEKLFSGKWWVYTCLQFELGFEYKGFNSKQEAYAFYKQRKAEIPETYFDVLIFQLRPCNLVDFIPFDHTYPVEIIMEKKYNNYVRRSKAKKKQKFIFYFHQYLHQLLRQNFLRSGEEDVDFWWGLLKELEDVEKELVQGKYWVYHLYEIYDAALFAMYDGGNTDIENYK